MFTLLPFELNNEHHYKIYEVLNAPRARVYTAFVLLELLRRKTNALVKNMCEKSRTQDAWLFE